MSPVFATELSSVIDLANRLARENGDLTPQEAATKSLREVFGLAARDGIWGGSYAAVSMGYRGHGENVDLLEQIASDIAKVMDVPKEARPAGSRMRP